MPILQLEQHVRQEIEQNPMLDETSDDIVTIDEDSDFVPNETMAHTIPQDAYDGEKDHDANYEEKEPYQEEHHDPFDFYESAWNEGNNVDKTKDQYEDDDDSGGFQIKDTITFTDDLISQVNMLNLTDEMRLICYTIIGNLEDDGYLRRSLEEIVDDINTKIAEENHKLHRDYLRRQREFLERSLRPKIPNHSYFDNLEDDDIELAELLSEPKAPVPIEYVNLESAEMALHLVQSQEPSGIASRNLRECLLLQLKAKNNCSAAEELAKNIIDKSYDVFVMKHYPVLCRQHNINEDDLKKAIDAIRRLNPKPGGMGISQGTSTVIPDFMIIADDESDDLIITVNDNRIPQLRLNKMYEDLKKEARYRKYNKETREWLRKKYDDAKFLLQAIRQRKKTMLKVMTGIAGAQKDFFRYGESALKPLIYKDVADVTGMDVSTICRIVNGKYVQTSFGTFELRYFFSESLPSDDGEEISTRVIKQKIKELIDKEPNLKPHSDDRLTKELKKQGLNVARRTVAKYREQLRIPVARLRKEL